MSQIKLTKIMILIKYKSKLKVPNIKKI